MIEINEDKPLTEGRFVQILNDRLGIKDEEYPICLVLTQKHLLDSLKLSKQTAAAGPKEKVAEQKREDSDNPSETTDDIGFEPPPITDPYLTKKEVAKLIGFSTSSIDKWVKQGKFPEPVKFGKKNSRWRTSAAVSWMEEKEKESAKKKTGN